ncbi:L-seryl-tRNA(Sec) selenium transferase [Alicyclobacillus sp. SO9]|uniref:L-seryl-tRNA(Sec) selenium transferase n=1 Tax=Alicyclobacillus sp. SO9 TaxID=2665646 RepID=UPI001E50E05D|nr:L-seryl-tRNA(Sec) selenium transferase [Alicyclobacillus sp. SO9]
MDRTSDNGTLDKQSALRSLPAVHKLISSHLAAHLIEMYSKKWVTEAVEEVLSSLRQMWAGDSKPDEAWWKDRISETGIMASVHNLLKKRTRPVLREVLNLTGVVIHTNLGRAPLSERALNAVSSVARGYSNLEYDLQKGQRGSRHDLVEQRLCQLTGAQAAMVVNNNAAAVFLVLRELAQGGEAVVSRGELVEIGGSFRIPAIMEESGVGLVEVGTTNKTHLADYRRAITENTKMLLRVHTSNFRIVGFTERPALAELAETAKEHGVYLYEDLGSGALIDFRSYGIGDEETVMQSLRAGVDVVSFSGDKLLGGAQAGIIAGKKDIIGRLKKNQLARMLRVDKMTLAALEATLIDSANPDCAPRTIPVPRMLTETATAVRERAEVLVKFLHEELAGREEALGLQPEEAFGLQLIEDTGRVGGGALPLEELPSTALELKVKGVSSQALFDGLRQLGDPPVIGRLVEDRVRLNVRTLLPGEEEICAHSVAHVVRQLLHSHA